MGSCWDFIANTSTVVLILQMQVFVRFSTRNGANDVLEGDFLNVQFFDHIEDDRDRSATQKIYFIIETTGRATNVLV